MIANSSTTGVDAAFRFTAAVAVLLCVAGCDRSDDEVTHHVTAAADTAPSEQPLDVVPSEPEPENILTLSAGFMPDPYVYEGTTTGVRDASGLGRRCTGFIAEEPDFELVATRDFTELFLLAHSETDVGLVVETPKGEYLCNRDYRGWRSTDPRLDGYFHKGTYRIWLTVPERDQSASFLFGLSELATVQPKELPEFRR